MLELESHLGEKRHVIWDWNGTLLDDFELARFSINEVLREHRLPELDAEQYREKFCFPIRRYYESLGFDFSRLSFEKLAPCFIDVYRREIHRCRLHTGAPELLARLSGRGIRQSILSAAHEEDLHRLLRHFQIDRFFAAVYGLDHHYASSKLDRGRELLRVSGVPLAETVLIGDTDHDLEVGRDLGIDVVLVTQGHQAEHKLTRLHHRVHRR
jgi:phosphoglycolate phosphatase